MELAFWHTRDSGNDHVATVFNCPGVPRVDETVQFYFPEVGESEAFEADFRVVKVQWEWGSVTTLNDHPDPTVQIEVSGVTDEDDNFFFRYLVSARKE